MVRVHTKIKFRGFKSHRANTRKDFFIKKKKELRKARERELLTATFDENRREVGVIAEPYAR